MEMNMKSFIPFSIFYVAARIGEKVLEKIGDLVLEHVVPSVCEYLATSIIPYLFNPFGLLLCYNRNIKDFRTQLKNLKNTRDKVQEQVDTDEKNGEVRLPKVQKWLTSVNQIIKDTENLFVDKLQLNNYLKLRYQGSRMAKEKTSVVDELIQKGSSFNRVSTFESRKLTLEEIMEGLKDDRNNMIGIFGVGFVGKTTLVKEVLEEAKYDNLFFDEAVMARVSSEPNLEKIQGEIASMLGLRFDGNDGDAGKARQLFARLDDREKRILVILDDVWKNIDLGDIGIPFGEEHKGCKVVLTSREKEVCHKMGSVQDIQTEVLSEKEGWILFRKIAGDIDDSPDLHPLRVEVAKKCAGLPMAIWEEGRAWRKKSLSAVKVVKVKEMFGLDHPVPSADNNKIHDHSFGSSTYRNPKGRLSVRCVPCEQIWMRNNSMDNYQKLIRGEHIR